MKMHQRLISSFLMMYFVASICIIGIVGCQNLTDIPAFNPKARLINQIASVEEIETQVNLEIAEDVKAEFLTQAEVDKLLTPSIDKAEKIWKAARAGVHATTQPTTTTAGTLEDAKAILLSVRSVLEQMRH